jgi:signal transduction histidine kinase
VKVANALIQILKTPDIETAMATLTDLAANITLAPPPSLFVISTQKATFVGVFGKHMDAVRPWTQKFSENRYVVGIRDDLVIGFLEWDEPIAAIDNYNREIISAVIEEIYRRLYVRNFFTNIRRPVDFTNQDTYFRDTAKLLSDSLSMEMVAIRQINLSDNLDCRAFFHYPDRFGDRVDFDGYNMPLPFQELVTETRRVLLERKELKLDMKFEIVDPLNTQRYGFLLEDDQLKQVKAFAIFPIVFGDEFFGVVSCSTTAPFRFSSLEKSVIQTAMQLISVAISNFIMFHEAKRMTDVIHDQLFSTTELEIAQSARHELQNIEAEQVLHIDEIDSLSRNVKDKSLPEVISKLKDTVLKLDSAISKLRYSGVHAAPKLEKTSVEKVWTEATNLMQERLNMMGIKPKYVGSNLDGFYYADWLREAFLNLLFNSIDAFHDRPRQNRSITMVVQKESEASQYHILDYSDNAGGIAFGKLNVPEPIKEANPGMRPEQLIFQPKVTSKKSQKGAGWGLYLVRQALRLHNGSISLRANTKEGCTFRIQLRKNLQEQHYEEVI